MTWSPGSLVFKIDGVTSCVIRQPYVPKSAMYLKVSVFAGAFRGPIKKATLPWETLIDYVKVTQGSTVVFDDEFNSGATIVPGPKGNYSGFSDFEQPRFFGPRRGSVSTRG